MNGPTTSVAWIRRELSRRLAGRTIARLRDEAVGEPRRTRPHSARRLVLDRYAAAVERALGLRPSEAQRIAALAMHEGFVVEVATGEGKTLALALAAALFANEGRSVHVATSNDYLARRDAEAMGPFFASVGVSVDVAEKNASRPRKRQAYAADVVYAAFDELAFDGMRDQRSVRVTEQTQRTLDVLLVDEIDAALLDLASTPFVLSGEPVDLPPAVLHLPAIVETLRADVDYALDRTTRLVVLTERGMVEVERRLHALGLTEPGLFEDPTRDTLGAVLHALHAHVVVERDRDYAVTDEGQLALIDPRTGRHATSRRWADGLHAAVEAKERLPLSRVTRPLDSIGAWSLARLYARVAGASGTAASVEDELADAIGVRTLVIPRDVPTQRVDEPDRVHPDDSSRLAAVVDTVRAAQAQGRPVLVGAWSDAEAIAVSQALDRVAIPHRLLTGAHEASEAGIVAAAGREGAVTVATPVAGRGTDIRLGGLDGDGSAKERVVARSGLLLVGVRHARERRLDDQLRGRAGRRGDPGTSVFFVAEDDDGLRDAKAAAGGAHDAIARWQRENAEAAAAARRSRYEAEAVHDMQRRHHRVLRTEIVEGRYAAARSVDLRHPSLRPDAVESAVHAVLDELRLDSLLCERLREGRPGAREFVASIVADQFGTFFAIAPGDLVEPAYRASLVSGVLRGFAEQRAHAQDVVSGVLSGIAHGSRRGADASLHRRFVDAGFPFLSDARSLDAARAMAFVRLDERLASVRPRVFFRGFRLAYLGALDDAYVDHLADVRTITTESRLADGQARRFEHHFPKAMHESYAARIAAARRRVAHTLLVAPLARREELDRLEAERDAANERPEHATAPREA